MKHLLKMLDLTSIEIKEILNLAFSEDVSLIFSFPFKRY